MTRQNTFLYPYDPSYPDDDGEPMGEGTLQIDWIMQLGSGFQLLYFWQSDVLTASNLLWYPVQGDAATRIAPHVMIVLGRPNADRYSYLQWKEGGHAPQFVLDVHPRTRPSATMADRLDFFQRHGVQEYIIFDPHLDDSLMVRVRCGTELVPVSSTDGWVSPLLRVGFRAAGRTLIVTPPGGRRFVSYRDSLREYDDARTGVQTSTRVERLAAKLRELGVDPNSI